MKRPVWLFSLDCEQFTFLPLTTAGLKSYFLKYGDSSNTRVELVHFRYHAEAIRWLSMQWETSELLWARRALKCGITPVAAFSSYTWNMPTFLRMIARMKETCPDLLVVTGGPQAQHIDSYVRGVGIDVIVLGEGEATFTELLDARSMDEWKFIPGLAFADSSGRVVKTPKRDRFTDLNSLPSALDVVPFTDPNGRPYRWAAYETMRGCPYRCAYCQWGTGAIGTKVTRFATDRVRSDLEQIVARGVEGILFCDSNFGALPDDPDKAEWLIQLKERFGRPTHFATCWSKNHNSQVQNVVRRLHEHRLLEHYTMALQTLTPLALRLANRMNMPNYRAVAKAMVSYGVPIVSELIWGLPGDTLAEFEQNLDQLTRVFPSHTIYPYAMLPGTDLFDRRDDYRIKTIQLAPYGEARADYIISCVTFDQEEGLNGYSLITACILLYRGNVIPLTLRYLALRELISVSRILRTVHHDILDRFVDSFPALQGANAAAVFANREFLYRWILDHRTLAFEIMRETITRELETPRCLSLINPVKRLLLLDEVLCPRKGGAVILEARFDFPVERVFDALERMELPGDELFALTEPRDVRIAHGWDFGDDLVPKYQPAADQTLRGRYPVWP